MLFKLKELLKRWGISRPVFLLGFARMADAFGASSLIILIPLYVKHLGIELFSLPSTLLVGILLSVFGLVNSLTQPSVGVWHDRLRRSKPFIIVGLLIYATCTATFIFARGFVSLFLLRVFQGVGVALTIPPSFSLMTVYTEKENRGTALGFFNIMRLAGFSIGPLVTGYLVGSLGFTPVLLLGAGMGWLGSLLVYLLVEEPPTVEPESERESLAAAYGRFFKPEMKKFYFMAAPLFSQAVCVSLIASLENQFIRRLPDMTPADFGLAFSTLLFTVMIFQVPLGRLSDYVGRKILIIFGLCVLIPVTVGIGYVQTTFQLLVARALQGLSMASISVSTFALGADQSAQETRGRELSLLSMAFGLGIGLGPTISGGLVSYASFQTPFWFGALLATVALFIVIFQVEEIEPVPPDVAAVEPD